MLYLDTKDILTIGVGWLRIMNLMETAVRLMTSEQYEQPIKPYLHLDSGVNRIIAMPAFLGGGFNRAGIKWISSFPGNHAKGLPRAHAITVVNCVTTGRPQCLVNSTMLSGLRTAGVSALLLREALRARPRRKLEIGLIGCGMIGGLHIQMIKALFPEWIGTIHGYDLRPEAVEALAGFGVPFVNCRSWAEVIEDSDIVITATCSSTGYIDTRPRPGAILLNISLRDFAPEFRPFADYIIVDSWEEVCRKNTDIERMHKKVGLTQKDTHSLAEVVVNDVLEKREAESVVMFNPMGLAIFDIAIAGDYYEQAKASRVGLMLS